MDTLLPQCASPSVKSGTNGSSPNSPHCRELSSPRIRGARTSITCQTTTHQRTKRAGTLPRPTAARCVGRLAFALALFFAAASHADEVVFADNFNGKLGDGWSWLREDRNGWRLTNHGLEIRVQPGNMWGPGNNAKNVLLRTVPDPAEYELEISASITNQPTAQFEQVDLVWYYDDSHMVKLGQELVDGRLSIVMGREQADKTRTIAIIPLHSNAVQLRLRVAGNRIQGLFRTPEAADWQKVGECDLPVQGMPKVSLQCYQGPADAAHWARITEFRIRRHEK